MTEELSEVVADEEVVAAEGVDTVAAEEPSAPEWSDEDAEAAKALGWKDPAEWEGEKPAGFIDDPRRYLERAESFGPFRKLREQMEAQGESLRKIEVVTAKAVERVREQERERFEAELAAIREGQRRAVEEADTDTFDALEKKREGLKAPEFDDVAPAEADPLAPFKAEKPWLNDPVLVNHGSILIDGALKRGAISGDVGEQIAYAERELAKYYPHMFAGDKAKPKASPVAGDVIAPSRKKSGFDSLPSDAKSAFMSEVKKGIFKNIEEDREFFYNEYTAA